MAPGLEMVDEAAADAAMGPAPGALADEGEPMVKFTKLVGVLLALALTTGDAWALARHAITATAKASGSRNLVVLPSAQVRVYLPGATASSSSSGTVVTVYDSSTIQVGDTVKVNGQSAEVTDVPDGTSFEIDTQLSWSSGVRFLRSSEPIDIYADAGGTTPITQPATADSSGRLTFFYDSTIVPTFDLEATSSDGLRMVDYGISNPGEGTSAGGWTDNGATVTTSTNADLVGIGGTPSGTKLALTVNDSQAPTVSPPTEAALSLVGDTNSTDWRLFLDSGQNLTFWNLAASQSLVRLYPGIFARLALGDIANVDVTNPGTLTVRPRTATHRGLVISGASGQSSNLLEIRDNTEAVKFSCAVAGSCTATTTLAAGEDVTATDDVIAGDDVVATDDLNGAGLVVTGTTASFRGLEYTMPSAHTTNGVLKNDGAGALSWTTTGICAPISIKMALTTGSTTEYFSLNAMEATDPTTAQSSASELDARSWIAPSAFTASSLRVLTAGTLTSGAITYTLMNTGSATAITCTVTAPSTTCTSASTAAIAAGDRLSIRAGAASAGTGVAWVTAGFCLGP